MQHLCLFSRGSHAERAEATQAAEQFRSEVSVALDQIIAGTACYYRSVIIMKMLVVVATRVTEIGNAIDILRHCF